MHLPVRVAVGGVIARSPAEVASNSGHELREAARLVSQEEETLVAAERARQEPLERRPRRARNALGRPREDGDAPAVRGNAGPFLESRSRATRGECGPS